MVKTTNQLLYWNMIWEHTGWDGNGSTLQLSAVSPRYPFKSDGLSGEKKNHAAIHVICFT